MRRMFIISSGDRFQFAYTLRRQIKFVSRICHLDAVQSPLRKINRFAKHPNQTYNFRHPVPHEGRIAIVTDVGTGCGGRGSVGRDDIAGRVTP